MSKTRPRPCFMRFNGVVVWLRLQNLPQIESRPGRDRVPASILGKIQNVVDYAQQRIARIRPDRFRYFALLGV